MVPIGKLVNVSIKVPKELRDLMRMVSVNWSEYLREVIQIKLGMELGKKALNSLDETRMRVQEMPAEDLVKWIREDRERS
ncbi:MAG: hypothetical protein QXS68_08360 [Candidatus Methanomethylicaceae archaeon]